MRSASDKTVRTRIPTGKAAGVTAGRATYRAPVIREFGCVRNLTQAGTAGAAEGGMGMGGGMMGSMNPNRRA